MWRERLEKRERMIRLEGRSKMGSWAHGREVDGQWAVAIAGGFPSKDDLEVWFPSD